MSDCGSETARRALFFQRGQTVDDDDKRLTDLKEEILLNSDLKSKNYDDPEQLYGLILPMLQQIIGEDFPLEKIPTPLEVRLMCKPKQPKQEKNSPLDKTSLFPKSS